MDLSKATVLVTGANRGLGSVYVDKLLERGAKVYAGARKPEDIAPRPGVTPLRLDVTDPRDVAAVAMVATDVNLLINNAGVLTVGSLLTADMAVVRDGMEINFYGPLAMARAFAPVIESNGGGTILNMLSIFSWVSSPGAGTYSASKAAVWSLTNALRIELAPRNVHVAGLHVGFVDTDMVRRIDRAKVSAESVVDAALRGIADGADEILADDASRRIKRGLSGDVAALHSAVL